MSAYATCAAAATFAAITAAANIATKEGTHVRRTYAAFRPVSTGTAGAAIPAKSAVSRRNIVLGDQR
jgi:hypothetical protein